MSQKTPLTQTVDECKEFDSASWKDDDEATVTAVEFQRLPSRGFRGALVRYYWVCSLHSMQLGPTSTALHFAFIFPGLELHLSFPFFAS